MFFRVLCLALVACTLVQAKNSDTAKPDKGWGILEPVRQGLNAFSDSKKLLRNAITEGIKAKVHVGTSFPRFLGKLWQKSTNQAEKSFPDNVEESAYDIIDENNKSIKKATDASFDLARAVFNTTAQAMNGTWGVTISFSQFLNKIIEAVGNRSDLSDAEQTEVRAAMKEISVSAESNSDAQEAGSKFLGGPLVYQKKFKPSNVAGSSE